MSLLSLALVSALVSTPGPAAPPVKVTLVKVIEGLRPIAYAAAPTGSLFVATMEDGSVRVMDARTRSTVRNLGKHPQPAYAVAWSPDGNFIATGDESARIWIENAVTGKRVREYHTHTKGIEKLSYNLPGNTLLSTGKDDQVNVYDLRSSKPKHARTILGKGMNFYGATFHPKLPYTFAVGMLGGGGRLYDANTGRVTNFLTDKDGQGVFDVCFNPAGTRAVSAGRDGNAILWDTKKCLPLGKFKGHGDWVVVTTESPNGRLVATSSSDQTVKVWDTLSMQKLVDLAGESPVGSPMAFTADGNTLVTVNDAGFLQFNAVTPSQRATESVRPVKAAKKRRRHRRG